MDIQKEREAFKQHLTDTGLVEFAGYGFAVDECDEYLHEPTQVAWDSWLIGLNRAKAQAVPKGFVVVPKEPTQKMLDATINVPIPAVYVDSISGQHKLKVAAYYKAMIEAAQEPTND